MVNLLEVFELQKALEHLDAWEQYDLGQTALQLYYPEKCTYEEDDIEKEDAYWELDINEEIKLMQDLGCYAWLEIVIKCHLEHKPIRQVTDYLNEHREYIKNNVFDIVKPIFEIEQ